MSDLSKMLEVARSALYSYRAAMDVTSQNIANAHTTGYTRQRVNLEPGVSVKTPYGYLGSGVDVKDIERMREEFIDQEIRNTNFQTGQATNQNKILNRIQSYINEPLSGGIATELDNFFRSWQNLASNPEDIGVRQTVAQQGVSLAKEFNYLSTGFDNTRNDIINEAQNGVKQVNDLIGEIGSLNRQIFYVRPSNANELEDLRDNRINELSKLIDIRSIKDENGMVNISAGGSTLISGVDSYSIEVVNKDSKLYILFAGTSNNMTNLFGSIGSDIESYNNSIPKFKDQLDLLAKTLIDEVNNTHKSGYGLPNSTTGIAPKGGNFFVGDNALSFKLNDAILKDVSSIAASADGSEGNNQIASDISKILDKPLFNNNTTSPLQFYRGYVTDLGFAVSDSQRLADALDKRNANLDNMKQSISGVSLDDEMVNLIKYQRSFDAASKVISTIDQLFDTILNMKK